MSPLPKKIRHIYTVTREFVERPTHSLRNLNKEFSYIRDEAGEFLYDGPPMGGEKIEVRFEVSHDGTSWKPV